MIGRPPSFKVFRYTALYRSHWVIDAVRDVTEVIPAAHKNVLFIPNVSAKMPAIPGDNPASKTAEPKTKETVVAWTWGSTKSIAPAKRMAIIGNRKIPMTRMTVINGHPKGTKYNPRNENPKHRSPGARTDFRPYLSERNPSNG